MMLLEARRLGEHRLRPTGIVANALISTYLVVTSATTLRSG